MSRLTTALAGALLAVLASGTAMAEPKSGGTLHIGSTQQPRHLNGAVQSGIATAMPSAQLFASLLRYDENWSPQPYLAETWQMSEDGKTLTLQLRKNAVFHDGKPITSEDVAFSLEVVKANHPFQTMLEAVEGIDTPDPHTVIVRMRQPHPALLLALSPALTPILPKHIYGDGQDVKSHPRNSTDVVGSGPFRLKEYLPGRQIVLERFDQYFLPDRPYLDRAVIQLNPDATSLMIGLERGDIHMLPFVVDPTILRRTADNPSLVQVKKGYEGVGALSWLAFNTSRKPFDDVRVRQAIAYAIDKNFVIKALHAGFASPSDGPIVASSPFATPDINKYPFDPKKAEALLDEAGLKRGDKGERFKMTIDYLPAGTVDHKNTAEYLRTQLKKVGITVEVRASPDFPSWAKLISSHDFDMTTDAVFNWADPVIGVHRTYLTSNIRPIIWSNTQSYSNPRVDELLEQAAKEPDAEKRKALYAEFQRIVTGDLPIIYMTETPYHTLASKKVGNLPKTIWGAVSPWDEVYLQ